jgi:hypothetical protein
MERKTTLRNWKIDQASVILLKPLRGSYLAEGGPEYVNPRLSESYLRLGASLVAMIRVERVLPNNCTTVIHFSAPLRNLKRLV